MKIIRGKDGKFVSTKGNQSACGNPPNKMSFKPNHIPHNFKGINKPRVLTHSRDGFYSVVTVDETKPAISRKRWYQTKKRISEAQYVMNTPRGMVTFHTDGDPTNNKKENLEIITRAELLKRNLALRRMKR